MFVKSLSTFLLYFVTMHIPAEPMLLFFDIFHFIEEVVVSQPMKEHLDFPI